MPDHQVTADPLTIVGAGLLRTEIERRLAQDRTCLAGSAVLGVSDGWDVDLLTRAAATAATAGVPFLGVHVELSRAVIGPVVRPGVPGCLRCVATRRAAADLDSAAERAALLERHRDRLAAASTWLTAFAVSAIAGIVVAELAALSSGRRPRTQRAVIVVELDRLLTEAHPFLPDPLCRVCATPPDDEPDAAIVRLVARSRSGPESLRVADLTGRGAELRRTYVDSFVGLVSDVRDVDAFGLPVSYARTGLPTIERPEIGIGRAADRATSGLAAVLEAVERRAGTRPSGRRVTQRAQFTDVAGYAVDPRTLGLPSPRATDDPQPAFPPFDPDRELDWVWGYSFGREKPILVPRTYAYFGHVPAEGEDRPLAYETSNGCALGSCLEEAVVYGLLEVTERDAFLLTWYARMPVPRVAVGSAHSLEIRLLAERIERTHGYRVLVFDTTLEHGIPSVVLLAVDLAPAPDRPSVMCTAAAHIVPERACWAALGELALVVQRQIQYYPTQRERAAAMAADSDLVRVMDDHVLLYGHEDTAARWDFLLGAERDDEALDFAESFPGRPEPGSDLRDDLMGLVCRYRHAGLDVIVVDQTGPEQRAAGLSTVKVIVPGTLPMTFGHRNRRVDGLPRLRTVPTLLGHRTHPLRDEDVNPYPHPFS